MRATRSCLAATAAVFLAVALAIPISAQQVQGALSIVGGSATDVVGVTSRAITLAPSLSVAPDPRVQLGLDASATRYDNQQWSLGGGASAALRSPLSHIAALTLNSGVTGATTSYDFSYATASALPAFEVSAGPVTGYAGARFALAATHSVTSQPTAAAVPFGGTPFSTPTVVSASRTALGLVVGGQARLAAADGETMTVGLREEHTTIDTTPTVDRLASIAVSHGIVSVGGSVGVRTEPRLTTTFGSGVLSLAVSPSASITFSAGAYPADRLIGTPAGHFLNLGVSMRTGSLRAPVSHEIEGVPAPQTGMTRLAIRAAGAMRVEVAGDFTDWRPIAAHRAPSDADLWFIDLRIPPGQYRYAFRIDGTRWAVPDGATAVDDDFGGKSAWLTVAAPSNSVR